MILIEKDKAIKKTWEEPSYSDPLNVLTEIRDRLNTLPTIEIVRCRECKHHDGIRCFRWNSTIITGFDDFCSNGERREEDVKR